MSLGFLTSAADLVTTREATRAGFIELVLEKNRRATPHVAQAKALRAAVLSLSSPRDLLVVQEIEPALIAAAGISDKAANHLTSDDRREAILVLITQFLEPEGEQWIAELVYRFLLTRGDTLGGEMRNVIGGIGQRKLSRALIATLEIGDRAFSWHHAQLKRWVIGQSDSVGIELALNGLSWSVEAKPRTLLFNHKPPGFSKNIDLCLVEIDATHHSRATLKMALARPEIYLAFGELKSGFDPAGADEHWKTAQAALNRIRDHYSNRSPATFFIGAAIVGNMADEVWRQLQSGSLSCAANLTHEEQLHALCRWLVNL